VIYRKERKIKKFNVLRGWMFSFDGGGFSFVEKNILQIKKKN
jgi:hypothetical protein